MDMKTSMIKKAKINVSFTILDILSIVEVDLEYTNKFQMILKWVDHRYIIINKNLVFSLSISNN